jgi:hypothetical protein
MGTERNVILAGWPFVVLGVIPWLAGVIFLTTALLRGLGVD